MLLTFLLTLHFFSQLQLYGLRFVLAHKTNLHTLFDYDCYILLNCQSTIQHYQTRCSNFRWLWASASPLEKIKPLSKAVTWVSSRGSLATACNFGVKCCSCNKHCCLYFYVLPRGPSDTVINQSLVDVAPFQEVSV